MNYLSSMFWSESFWLPPNVTWAELEHPPPGEEYPKAGHLVACLPLAFGVLALRVLFERLVAKPCAHILQIEPGVSRRAQPNAVLERVFASTASPDSRRIEGLSKQLDWDVRKVQRWFRLRRNQDKPSTLTKFCESMWRLTFYTGIFMYAIRHLWVSPWMWDTRQCWYNYPFQALSPGQYNYYVAELAFYWSLMFSQFTDIKRKDFLIMFVHHLATITLITFSYCNNMLRAGTLVMCVHDAADIFLELAKLANYAKYQRICDTAFIVFSIIFFITRLWKTRPLREVNMNWTRGGPLKWILCCVPLQWLLASVDLYGKSLLAFRKTWPSKSLWMKTEDKMDNECCLKDL
uniref:Homeobox domain-containing protein n=1 Tax=Esox lucius TaxID=8010 RepID=A0A6Q2XVM7_ESOLU